MNITAMLCARNELPYLRHVLPYLAQENIEVVLVDNESSDGTLDEFAQKWIEGKAA